MARSKGSMSSQEAKDTAAEIEALFGIDYKYGINFMRAVEMLLCLRISEQVADTKPDEEGIQTVEVELPLLGDFEIRHSKFHENHRLTNEASSHFEFNFKPSSGFKADLIKAFNLESDVCDVFATIYSNRLQELYKKLVESEGL